MGVDAIIYPNRDRTVFKGHTVFLNGDALKVPTLIEITQELARRYRLRKSESGPGDMHLGVQIYLYFFCANFFCSIVTSAHSIRRLTHFHEELMVMRSSHPEIH